MKISIVEYDAEWPQTFEQIKGEILDVLGSLNVQVEHMGSTAVPGLAAKPVIDIAVGVRQLEDLDKTIQPMIDAGFIYYEIHNAVMPLRRMYVRLQNEADRKLFPERFVEGDNIPHDKINEHRLAHVHIWEEGAPEWNRHIAFREYLKAHPEVKEEYGNIKRELSKQDWKTGMDYNDGKNDFIKTEEAKAIAWYKK